MVDFILTTKWKTKFSKLLKKHEAEAPMGAALAAFTTFKKNPTSAKGQIALDKLKVLRNKLDAAAKAKDVDSFKGYGRELDSYVFDVKDTLTAIVQDEFVEKKEDYEVAVKDFRTRVEKLDALRKEAEAYHKAHLKDEVAHKKEAARLNGALGKMQKDINLRKLQATNRREALDEVQAAAMKVKGIDPAIHKNVTKVIVDAKKEITDLTDTAKAAGMIEKDLE